MTDKPIPHIALVKHQGAEFILPGAAPSEADAESAIQTLYPNAQVVAALPISHYIDAALLNAAQDLYDAVRWGRDTDAAMLTLRRCITQSETRSLGAHVSYLASQPFTSPFAVAT